MDDRQHNFYFVQFGDVIRGPYPMRTILELFRKDEINVYTRCSADKQTWENLEAVLQRHGVRYTSIERTVALKEEVPDRSPDDEASHPLCPVTDEEVLSASPETMRSSSPAWGSLLRAVCGVLWHPESQLPQLTGRAGRAFWIALMYQIFLTAAVTAGRGFLVLHRPEWWKQLWFASLEMVAVLTVVFTVVGITLQLCRSHAAQSDSAPGAIIGGIMICTTWTATLFLLMPTHFFPWHWREWLTVVFLAMSFTWFAVMTAELLRQWLAGNGQPNRYAAIFSALLMMLGATAIEIYLIHLYGVL